MPDIQSVREYTHDGKEGFVVEWQFIGFSKGMAKFRSVCQTAMRFPTTITTCEIVGVKEFGKRDYNIQVFVPTEDFMSAGISNPIQWMRREFKERFLD